LATVDRIASWNRQYINPAVYSIRTDFGRLAKRYEAVRGRKLEELKQRYPFAGGEMRRRGGRTLQTLGSLESLRGGLGRGGVRRAG
jgi:hypothetical protein